MTKQVALAFCGTSDPTRAIDGGQARNVNWYPDKDLQGNIVLHPTPGYNLIKTLAGRVRGTTTFADVAYIVVGDNFCAYDGASAVTILGSLTGSTNPVTFTCSGQQILMVDGVGGYVWNLLTNTFSTITDPDFPNGARHCEYMDGIFIVENPNTGEFHQSELLDATVWNSDVTSAEGSGDYLVAPVAFNNGLWLIGTETCEQYANTGLTTTPFARVDGSIINYGCVATYSIAKSAESFIYLAKNPLGGVIPLMVTRGQWSILFNQSYIYKINRLSRIDDAEAFVYQQDGHEYYVLTFPSAGVTYVHDLTTGMSHERSSFRVGIHTRWSARFHFQIGVTHYITDYDNFEIHILDPEIYTEAGATITRSARSVVYRADNNLVTASKLQLECEMGVGLNEGQGVTPEVMMRYSTDGGHTFSNEQIASLGTAENYEDTAVWYCLGEGRKWVVDISVTDPVKWIILGLTADFSNEDE